MPQRRPPRTAPPRRTRARTASPPTAASAAPPEARVRANEDLQIDPRNANRGTPRGRALLESSLREYGAGRAVLTDRDDVLIAGNKTFEVAQRLGLPTRVIETDGQELVVVRRRDLHLASDPKAQATGDRRQPGRRTRPGLGSRDPAAAPGGRARSRSLLDH